MISAKFAAKKKHYNVAGIIFDNLNSDKINIENDEVGEVPK